MRTADRVVFGQQLFRLASFACSFPGIFLRGCMVKPCPWSRNPMLRTRVFFSFALPIHASDRSPSCVCSARRCIATLDPCTWFHSRRWRPSFPSPSDPRCRVSSRTKMPPSLSNIQCLGALRRLRCFLVPRTPIVCPKNDEGGGGVDRSNSSRSNSAATFVVLRTHDGRPRHQEASQAPQCTQALDVGQAGRHLRSQAQSWTSQSEGMPAFDLAAEEPPQICAYWQGGDLHHDAEIDQGGR